MKIDKKKTIEKIIIMLIIVLFITMGLIIYERYTKKPESQKETVTDNYYNSEFLFNNDYIKVANEIIEYNDENNNIYMYLDGENVFHIKYKNDINKTNKEIQGLPQGNIKVYYSDLSNNCYEFAGLSKNDLYYTNFCLDSNRNHEFEKISTSTKEIYVPSNQENGLYVIDNDDITSNFIIDTTTNEIKYISLQENVLGLYNSIKETKPYFDYICASNNTSICKNTMYYINFEKELVFNYDLNNSVKTENNEKLKVQDIFGIFEIKNQTKVILDDLNYKKFSNTYDYNFKIYILDINNNLYTIDMNNNSVKSKTKNKAKLLNEEKVKSITYETNENNDISSVIINYSNGKYEKIDNNDNYNIVVSTLYNNNNKNILNIENN